MSWLLSIDTALFRFINVKLSNPVFDAIMPQFADNSWFVPAIVALAVWLLFKGGARGRLLVLMLILVLAFGDSAVINPLKKSVNRPRPHSTVPEAILLVGEGRSGSMPSSHTSTWCAAALVAFACYRRSWRFMVPLALLVGFSRVYVGVHYPTDVLAGAILGLGYAIAGLWALDAIWRFAGRRWFPIWWNRVPSLFNPASANAQPSDASREPRVTQLQWLRVGYVLIAILFVARLIYIGSGRIELSEDEAYQWLWSKHLALSYYSKPPMIAFAQFIGTSIWGDREIGVRFLSPVIAALLSVLLLHFMAREVSTVAGFWTVTICAVAPLPAVGSTLMTVDPLLVLFWTAAMIVGWRAVQPTGTTLQWLTTALLIGLGFLSKYTAAIQIVCFALFFLLWKPSRTHLRKSGPWLALGVFALCTLPVIIWNAQHGWITVHHVGENAKLDKPWEPTLRYFFEFLGAEAGLLNPVFFVAALWATFAFWHRDVNPRETAPVATEHTPSPPSDGGEGRGEEGRQTQESPLPPNPAGDDVRSLTPSQRKKIRDSSRRLLRFRGSGREILIRRNLSPLVPRGEREKHGATRARPLLLYFFAMGAPVFFGYWLYSLHSRILPNWIAAAVVPMFCLAVAYWHGRWQQGVRAVGGWLSAGMIAGIVIVVICHDTGLIHKLTKRRLPAKIDPHRRVDGWKETAQAVGAARRQLLSDGREVFIIGSHYGLTGQITFYLPDARPGLPDNPLVYYRTSDKPRNQFYFWPGYRQRHKGANAIYVDEAKLPRLKRDWVQDWLAGRKDIDEPDTSPPDKVPKEVLEEFESVTYLGTRDITVRGRVLRRVQLYACRNLLR
jgi:4-amino-4-deoxy-L-arabinose transferase-like glycosyltransferase/membrane-associated phospholipid phosphatase